MQSLVVTKLRIQRPFALPYQSSLTETSKRKLGRTYLTASTPMMRNVTGSRSPIDKQHFMYGFTKLFQFGRLTINLQRSTPHSVDSTSRKEVLRHLHRVAINLKIFGFSPFHTTGKLVNHGSCSEAILHRQKHNYTRSTRVRRPWCSRVHPT